MWQYSVLVKITKSLLCVTNHCIKVTSKLILPSVSRFKFPLIIRVDKNQFLTNVIQLKLFTKRSKHLLTVLKLITII